MPEYTGNIPLFARSCFTGALVPEDFLVKLIRWKSEFDENCRYWLVLMEARSWVAELMEVPSVTVVDEVTAAGSTWRKTVPAIAGTTTELTVVVEFLANVPPTCVPAPPLHKLVDQPTAHTKSVKVGDPEAGLEIVTL
jgi:hypothetical protein